MALVPSSSLWSSIKIPFCLYSKRKIAPTIPYVDSCKDIKQRNYNREAEPAREMVSLKVPTPLSYTEENPVPHLRPLSITLKKRTHRKSKTKQIGCVMVPGGDSLDGSNDREEICSRSFEKAILNAERSTSSRLGEDLNRKWSEFYWEEVSGECDCIPSVKPWMCQEQKRKPRKGQKVTEDRKRKNNEKERIIINCKDNTSGSSNSNGLKTFQGLHDKHSKERQKPTAKVKEATTYANYCERKLAELYSIELGLKI